MSLGRRREPSDGGGGRHPRVRDAQAVVRTADGDPRNRTERPSSHLWGRFCRSASVSTFRFGPTCSPRAAGTPAWASRTLGWCPPPPSDGSRRRPRGPPPPAPARTPPPAAPSKRTNITNITNITT
eukprot:258081-Prorocentrum_minimum.AAC.1